MSLIASITADPASKHIEAIRKILDADVFPAEMGKQLREYCSAHLNTDAELYIEVFDRLQTEKVISKIKFRELWNYAE